MNNPLFSIGKEEIPILVDYGMPLAEMWERALKVTNSFGNLELNGRTFPHTSGVKYFVGHYAVLLQDGYDAWEMHEDFQRVGIMPADMRQLFAFCSQSIRGEVTKEKTTPIVAAAIGSTWRCSHDCLHEMAGVHWDGFYHNPGISLHTESTPMKAGTRFLSIRRQ